MSKINELRTQRAKAWEKAQAFLTANRADILRVDSTDALTQVENGKVAVMYTVAYFYEHREEADHHALTLTLRSLLFGSRKEAF